MRTPLRGIRGRGVGLVGQDEAAVQRASLNAAWNRSKFAFSEVGVHLFDGRQAGRGSWRQADSTASARIGARLKHSHVPLPRVHDRGGVERATVSAAQRETPSPTGCQENFARKVRSMRMDAQRRNLQGRFNGRTENTAPPVRSLCVAAHDRTIIAKVVRIGGVAPQSAT